MPCPSTGKASGAVASAFPVSSERVSTRSPSSSACATLTSAGVSVIGLDMGGCCTDRHISSPSHYRQDHWNCPIRRIDSLDNPDGVPAGQDSFDQLAGSIEGLFDFNCDRDDRDFRPLLLDDMAGQIVLGASREILASIGRRLRRHVSNSDTVPGQDPTNPVFGDPA